MSIVGTVSRVTSFSRLVVFCVLFFTPSCSFWLVWLNPDEKKNKKEKKKESQKCSSLHFNYLKVGSLFLSIGGRKIV